MSKAVAVLLSFLLATSAAAQSFAPVPFTFAPNTVANASQMMANFQSIINSGNAVSADLAARIASKSPLPSGTIAFFNLTSCPAGWTLKSTWNDRFVRGLDLGAGKDPGNTLSQLAASRLQSHTHSVSGTGDTNTAAGANALFGSAFSTVVSVTKTSSYNRAVTSGDDADGFPKYVKLLICKKN
jgi:hypothetical protein